MSTFTNFLNLFMWDSIEDSDEEFDIDKALNENWKKIDNKLETHINNVNTEISEFETNVTEKVNELEEKIDITQISHKYIITTETEIAENTDYEIPCYYKVGEDVLDIYYMGEKLIKNVHYKEVGESGTISNKIQFYNWGQAVPTNRTIEFVVRGVYTNES